MGGSWSSTFSRMPSGDTKTIINTILKKLITDINMQDMYSLSDPRMCKEYIVVATTGLQKLFATRRINKTKDGVLLFQKIKGLQYDNPDPQKQAQYCKELSFFFVSIFQIYAAIALTIMDGDMPDVNPEYIEKKRGYTRYVGSFIKPGDKESRGYTRRSFMNPFRRNNEVRIPISLQQGGALNEIEHGGNFGLYLDPARVAQYYILNTYLFAPENPSDTRTSLKLGSDTGLFITQDSLYTFDLDGNRNGFNVPYNSIHIIYRTGQTNMEANIKIEIENDTNIRIKFADIKFGDKTLNNSETTFTTDDALPKKILDFFNKIISLEQRPLESSSKIINELVRYSIIGPSKQGRYEIVDKPSDLRGNIYIKENTEDNESNVIIYYNTRLQGEDIRISAKLEMRRTENSITLNIINSSIITKPESLLDRLEIPQSRSKKNMEVFTIPKAGEVPKTTDKKLTTSQFFAKVFKDMLKYADYNDRNYIRDDMNEGREGRDGKYEAREGLQEPYNSDSIPESMRIKEVWKALAKKPAITAHCKARALQLLNIEAIKGNNNQAYSNMCFTKFAYAKDGSLPPAGQPISEEYGIKALAMLFVDKMVSGSPRLVSTDKFVAFSKKFKADFERLSPKDEEGYKKEPKKFSDIREKLMPGICETHLNNRVLVDSSVTKLRSISRELFNIQARHVGKSMRLLFKLFDERSIRKGEFALSRYVEENGMDAIDNIRKQARELLTDYYGKCEEGYKDGLELMFNKFKNNPESIRSV